MDVKVKRIGVFLFFSFLFLIERCRQDGKAINHSSDGAREGNRWREENHVVWSGMNKKGEAFSLFTRGCHVGLSEALWYK